jgi:hypothetical protein
MLPSGPLPILVAAIAPLFMLFKARSAGSKVFELALALLMFCLAACSANQDGLIAWKNSLEFQYPHTPWEAIQTVLTRCLELGVTALLAVTVHIPGWLIAVLGVGASVTVTIKPRRSA